MKILELHNAIMLTLSNFRLWAFLGLFIPCLCDQRLLIDQLRWEFLQIEDELWNFPENNLLHKSQEEAELYIATRFYHFDKNLSQIPNNILYGVEPLKTLPDFLFLYSDLKIIETMYQKFQEYQFQQISGSKSIAIEDIIYDVTSNKTGVKVTMENVYRITYNQDGNIRSEVFKMLTDNYWCKNTQQSPQQIFYNLYNLIALYDLKAYVLQQFAHLGNRLWEKEKNVDLSIVTRKIYERRVKNSIDSLTIAAKQPRDIWRCDPKSFVKGKNYDEFTRLLQGHVENEVDMSARRTCRGTCSDYSYTKTYGCYDYKSQFCQKVERCYGNIIGCFFVESDASVCISSSSYRRYDFIRYDSGKVYGKQEYCSNGKSVDSWTRWFVRCHYCMCLCDQIGPSSDRYINLRPVMADVKNNRIVTGIRLEKYNRLLHLRIQEGKLLPYGYINQSTVHWVPLDKYKITDNGILDKKDYFTLKYGERSMALDEIQVNEDNVVITGVGFQIIDGKINFQIYVSPFNWHTGVLNHEKGYHIYNSHPHGRSKLVIKNPDIPTKTTHPSEIFHNTSNSYIEFTHSDFDKDAAQTTIPFIDIQEVVNKPAVPLVGAGVYYKGYNKFGGFIAPRIKTYNYGMHVSNKLPKMEERNDVEESTTVEVN